MQFVKMHGAGNDYVYVNCYEQAVDDPAALAPRISDRHFGVGADGLILVMPPDRGVDADVRMRMYNADGSEAEMCGNGIRCVAKLAHDRGITTARPMRVQTASGVLSIDYQLDDAGRLMTATVDMGEPTVQPDEVPVDLAKVQPGEKEHVYRVPLAGYEGRDSLPATFVSMGNPHAVVFVDRVDEQTRETQVEWGRFMERHAAFPNRMNVHFVQVHSPDEATVLHWERGSGATLACGTGACAVAVAGAMTGRTARMLTTHLPGGDLTLEWRELDNHVYMTGPAVEVFTGDWPD